MVDKRASSCFEIIGRPFEVGGALFLGGNACLGIGISSKSSSITEIISLSTYEIEEVIVLDHAKRFPIISRHGMAIWWGLIVIL